MPTEDELAAPHLVVLWTEWYHMVTWEYHQRELQSVQRPKAQRPTEDGLAGPRLSIPRTPTVYV